MPLFADQLNGFRPHVGNTLTIATWVHTLVYGTGLIIEFVRVAIDTGMEDGPTVDDAEWLSVAAWLLSGVVLSPLFAGIRSDEDAMICTRSRCCNLLKRSEYRVVPSPPFMSDEWCPPISVRVTGGALPSLSE